MRVHARGALEQAAVQVEHVAGIRFASRRAAQQQRHLTVGRCLLGQVVIHNQRILPTVAEILAHGAAGVRGHILHGCRLGGRRRHNNGVVHRASFFQRAHHVFDGRGLLTDCHIDANHVLAFLIDDGVNRHSGFPRLAVANNQFTLAAPDGHHGVNGFQAGLHRLAHRLARNHAGRHFFNHVRLLGADRPLAVNRLPQGIDHAPHQFRTDGHIQNAPRAFDGVALGHVLVRAKNHGAHGIALQVERQAIRDLTIGRRRKLQHFALHGFRQTVYAHDAVCHRHHGALITHIGTDTQPLDTALDQF